MGPHGWGLRLCDARVQHEPVPRASLVTSSTEKLPALFRSPRRITVTLAHQTYEQLQQRCDKEGRSLSNLAAFLLEVALHAHADGARIPVGKTAASPTRR